MGERAGEPFAAAAVQTKNALAGLGDFEKNPENLQSAWIVAKVVWFVWGRSKDMPWHEGVFIVDGVEDEISLEAEAELHAARVIMEIGALSNGEKVAEAENGDAVDAVRTEVKDPITGFVTIGYLVSYHLRVLYQTILRR